MTRTCYALAANAWARSQFSWRPVRIVIPIVLPYEPGGGTDIIGRDVMTKLTERLSGSGADVVADVKHAQFGPFVRVEIGKSGKIIQAAGMTGE